jgi:hypothetical protein
LLVDEVDTGLLVESGVYRVSPWAGFKPFVRGIVFILSLDRLENLAEAWIRVTVLRQKSVQVMLVVHG